MNLGLRQKLLGSIVSLVVVLAGFLVIYYPWRYSNLAKSSVRARTEAITLALSSGLAESMRTDQPRVQAILEEFIRRSEHMGDLLYVNVVLPDQRVLAAWQAPDFPVADIITSSASDDAAGSEFVIWQENNQHLHASAMIFQPVPGGVPQQSGTLNLGVSLAAVDMVTTQSRIEAAVLGGAMLLISLLVAWLMGRSLVTPVLRVADRLQTLSVELTAAAHEQEASSNDEAAAVAGTRHSMQTLLDSAQKIAERSGHVLGHAEQTTSGSRQIADRIGKLNLLSESVADILGAIMQVADKADLLALNASLEGTRAGDAGKGFALVGAEMRRLAENVIESVSGIRELMNQMRDMSQATVMASEEGTRSSTATRQSAQEIANLTQGQRQATEHVIRSMDDLGQILAQTLDGIQRTSGAAEEISQLANDLQLVIKPVAPSQNVMAGALAERIGKDSRA